MTARLSGVLRAMVVTGVGLCLSACGTLTGIPSHGGGKRFAVEQELVASTVVAAAKDLDVSRLKGRAAAIYIVGMGDQGGGNIMGGRYSLNALLRGESVSTPMAEIPMVEHTTKNYPPPRTPGEANYPREFVARQPALIPNRTKGKGHNVEAGIRYNGLGSYATETILNPRDSRFLTAVVEQSLLMRGVKLTGADRAEFDIYVTVSVFGTVRSRHDWHLANRESLMAKTAMEMVVIDRRTGDIFIPPQTSSFEAEYSEQYALWAGPLRTVTSLRRSQPLLADFSDMDAPFVEVTRVKGVTSPVQ